MMLSQLAQSTVQESCWTAVLCSGLLSGREMARLKCVSKLLRTELQNEVSWHRHVYWYGLTAADLKEVLRLPVGGKLLHWSSGNATDPELKLAACVNNLYAINLMDCISLTSSGLAHLSSQRHLQTLDLSGCKELTDEGLAHLSSLPLQDLNLSGCTKLTGEGLAHLSSLPLQTLYLYGCEGLTDGGLAHLSSLPLQTLNLGYCSGLTDGGLAHLSSLPLQTLNLGGCSGLTDTAKEMWRQKLVLANRQ